MDYLAHIRPQSGETQSVVAHLRGTAELAQRFGDAFGAGDEACRCGMLHDMGKYSSAFQARIRGNAERVDHSTAGAQYAWNVLRDPAATFCIAGHHGGLPDLGSRMDSSDIASMRARLKREVPACEPYFNENTVAQLPNLSPHTPYEAFFYIHMLYSCLVDADYLDTEAFMSDGQIQRALGEPLAALEEKLSAHITPWLVHSDGELNEKRSRILRAALDKGESPPGLFTLTVPTGGGKTVASMAFALRHALRNGFRRILYIIPYTSIIEQTQRVFEDIFGAENVLAHYANVDYKNEENSEKPNLHYLATENWDAPIILTTAVQFFESLYGNRSSRCRKLHNIAGSVIIFDEAQMLPVPYLRPCIAAISALIKDYRCTAVLCTATQPSLAPLFAEKEMLPEMPAHEICPSEFCTDPIFRRVTYQQEGALSDEELAERLKQEKQVLCIVNRRCQAQELFALLPKEGAFHLSTAMYPAHRRRILEEIRRLLEEGKPCRVISTSLVEAGVDVDFGAVYRCLAGLDSMVQAAGRCNRNGKRAAAQSIVHLFESRDSAPPRMLRQNIAAAKRALAAGLAPDDPACIRDYFDFLFYSLKSPDELDEKHILPEIMQNTMPFQSVAEQFRLIETGQYTVYIPEGHGAELIKLYRENGPSRELLREMGEYAVGVYPQHFRQLENALEKLSENSAVLCIPELYSPHPGLSFEGEEGRDLYI